MHPPRTGLLIIRVWIEDGSEQPLRAQVSVTHDVAGGIEQTVTLVRADEVTRVVDDWILEMLGPTLATPALLPDH
jgi:propanediol dehydratase small subunit